MNYQDAPAPRRRFLTSSVSVLGSALALGSMAAVSGCGDDKGAGMVDNNPAEFAKTQDAQDSMKAALEQMKNRGANPSSGKKKK
jgi:hypothetical protein